MKNLVLLIALLSLVWQAAAQVSISFDNSASDPSAMLEIKSTSKGLLPPRMSQEELSLITNPANGLIVFCTTDNKLYMYLTSLGLWKEILMGTGFIQPQVGCGATMLINHIAGDVAPVNKVTSYGTVTGIPGEPLKCILTSNLGSDHQAVAMNDATEASAGWYWQFNRKQGYKHDGTTRTPATVWTGSYNENSAWMVANDPCRIELGGLWRILTITEWSNLYTTGGWTNWTGPWNSPLKLHVGELLT